MQQNRLGTALDNLVDMLFLEHRFSVNDHVVTFDRNHLARILVHEILDPGRKNPGGQLAADGLLQSGFGHFHFVREIENLEDLLIGFETDGTQQGRNGQLFLRSMYAYITLLMSVANSIHDPLNGMIRAE